MVYPWAQPGNWHGIGGYQGGNHGISVLLLEQGNCRPRQHEIAKFVISDYQNVHDLDQYHPCLAETVFINVASIGEVTVRVIFEFDDNHLTLSKWDQIGLAHSSRFQYVV